MTRYVALPEICTGSAFVCCGWVGGQVVVSSAVSVIAAVGKLFDIFVS